MKTVAVHNEPGAQGETDTLKKALSKVPEVTLFFWIIKVLCTTVGETAADFLNVNLNLGLTITSVIMGVLFIASLVWQFKTKKYTPLVYWLTVALISVFGTLVTDNLSDNLHVPLEYSTILFTVLLVGTFAVWYAKEKTLSIHSIFTPRREAFYWLAILFTFALGTAAGDLMAEALGLGYLVTGLIVAGTIAAFAVAWRAGLNAVIAFWFIYIMTRPLGASLGDFLSQSHEHGGLGLGPTNTSIIFVAGIILTVAFLAFTQKDVVRDPLTEEREDDQEAKREFWQLPVVIILILTLSIGGYYFRHRELQSAAAATQTGVSGLHAGPLGDVTQFKSLAQAIVGSVQAGDWPGANKHVNDLEYAWDAAQAQLKAMNQTAWTHVDGALDTVFREVRAVNPNPNSARSALQNLLGILDNP